MKTPLHLGTGTLTWMRAERVTDRYGAVYLIPDRHNSLTRNASPSLVSHDAAKTREGERGTLIAEVVETRESTHIGDIFRGLYPRTPPKGARIVLGSGTLFIEQKPEGTTVGLKPDDGRETDWLDPRALYDAHVDRHIVFRAAAMTMIEQMIETAVHTAQLTMAKHGEVRPMWDFVLERKGEHILAPTPWRDDHEKAAYIAAFRILVRQMPVRRYLFMCEAWVAKAIDGKIPDIAPSQSEGREEVVLIQAVDRLDGAKGGLMPIIRPWGGGTPTLGPLDDAGEMRGRMGSLFDD